MKSLRMTLIALTSAALLSACERSGDSSKSKGSQAPAPQSDTSTSEPSSEEKQSAENAEKQSQGEQETAQNQTQNVPQPVKPVDTETQPKSDIQATDNKAQTEQQVAKAPEERASTNEQAKVEPKPVETKPVEQKTVAVPPVVPDGSKSDVPPGGSTPSGSGTASGPTSTSPQTNQEVATAPTTTTPESENQGPLGKAYKSLQDTWTSTSNQVAETASDLGTGIKDSFQDAQDATRSLVSPTAEEELRSEAFKEMRSHAEEVRDKAIADAHVAMAVTRARPLEEVRAAVQPNDEVSNLLVAMIAEPESEMVHEYSNLLVGEIFNEPEVAKLKVMKLQLGIRELSEQGLYDKDVADRVAYLQAVLDEKIRDEGSTTLLRDSLIVAGTSVTLGAIAGFHGFDGARRMVSEYSPKRSLAAVTGSIASPFRTAKAKVGALFKRKAVDETAVAPEISSSTRAAAVTSEAVATPAALPASGLRRTLSTFRLSSDKVVQRDIVALGVKHEDASDLSLQVVSRTAAGYQEFHPTNMPGLKFSVVDQWDNNSLGDLRRVVFAVSRWDHLNPRPVVVASRQIPSKEADDLARQLQYKSPDEGGKEFVMLVDQESGVVSPSRMTVSELEDSGTVLKAKPKAKKGTKSTKSVAEAQADGDIPIAVPVTKTAKATKSKEAAASPDVKSEEVAVPPATAQTEEVIPPVTGQAEEVAVPPIAAKTETQIDEALVAKTDEAPVSPSAADETVSASPAASPETIISETTIDDAAATVAATETRRSRLALAERTRALKARIRDFDLPWAATVTAATGIPLQAFLLEGYRAGRSYGEGHDALYLESLIPPDQLQKMTVNLSDVPSEQSSNVPSEQ